MLAVLLLAASASAAEFKPAGKAVATGVAELTLYAGIDAGDPFWYVEGKINDKPVLLRIATEDPGLTLTEASAGRVGLKVAGKDDKMTTSVSALHLGETATISGVKAKIGKFKDFAYGTDGSIGIAAFPDLAWAIDPSAGKVKVGPAGSGSVADTVGTGTPFSQSPETKMAVGAFKLGEPNVQKIAAAPLSANATFSGVSLDATVATGRLSTRVWTEVDGGADWYTVAGKVNPKSPLPAVTGATWGETEAEWREVTVAGVSAFTPVQRMGAGLLYAFLPPSRIGIDVLGHASMGVDAARKLYFLKAVGATAATPYADVLEARLRAELDAPPVAPPADAEAAKAAEAAKLAPLVALLGKTGQFAEAVEAGKRWTDADPNHCTSWVAYGYALLESGQAAAAKEPLRKAAEQYQAWAVRPLAERTKLAATEEKRSKAPEFDGVWAQPSSCFTAWSSLAVALVAVGDYAAVGELYPKYADLDDGLPLVAGNALLLQGNLAGAEAAYRQALQLSYTGNGLARGGMMLATRARSRDLALAQFEGATDEQHFTLRFFLLYGELLREQGGAGESERVLAAYLAKAPWVIPGWLALANEQVAAGHPNTDAVAKAQALLTAELAATPREGALHGWNAEALRLSGKLAEAAAEAEKAVALDPGNALGPYVLSRIAESAGDASRASDLRKRAGQLGANDPFYASLLATSPG